MKNVSMHEQNLQLHHEWVKLQSAEPESGFARKRVESKKRRLANEVITSNKNLLWSSIRQFSRVGTTDEHDLFAVAAEQLWRVFQEWDPERATLASAAKTYISGAVRREVARNEYPGMSYDMFTLRGKLLQISKQLQLSTGEVPTHEQIAEEAEVPLERVNLLLTVGESSLDAPAGDSEDQTLGDVIADEPSSSREDLMAALPDRDSDEMLRDLNPVGVAKYLLSTNASTYPLRRDEVSLLVGEAPHRSTKPVHDVQLEVACRQVEKFVRATPSAEQLAAVAGVREETAAEFLENR